MSGAVDLATKAEQKFLLQMARNTIRCKLGLGELPMSQDGDIQSLLKMKRGVFVTLKKAGSLRGCIGYPLPYKELAQGIVENATAAAFQDPRFPPLIEKELDEMTIEISLLTVPSPVSSPEEVTVGRDGIIISAGFNRGLLLPQVPVEQNWDREQFLDYGCLKASLPAGYWRKNPVTIEVFQAQVFGEDEFSGNGA